MPAEYISLHNHTESSLLDGAIKTEDLVKKARSFDMPAVAITDHGNMFGAVDFYQKAEEAGIKPIIGCEVYVAKDRMVKQAEKGARDAGGEGLEVNGKEKLHHHLVLLAANNEGYKNLISIVSDAYLTGFYRKPRTDWSVLSEKSAGLIALSACMNGEIPAALMRGDYSGARLKALQYRDLFGAGNFYLEVQSNGLPEQVEANRRLVALSGQTGIPLVGTNDCHYLNPDDWLAHDALLCIQTGKLISDQNRLRFDSKEFYFKSPREMSDYFREIPEACSNTLAIGEKCGFRFDLGAARFPSYKIASGESADDYIASLARAGLMKKFNGAPPEKYSQRLEFELKMITKMGFSGYLLIVYDFIDYAKTIGVPVGPGRGSVAGSLVGYCIGITNVDPIPYNLLFERFLNPDRISMPDIDVDFCRDGREKIIQYVYKKYGAPQTSQIITFGTMGARAAIRDVGRVLGVPLAEVDKIAKLVPAGPKVTIEKAMEMEPKFKEICRGSDKIKELIAIAKKLEGHNRHASVHAAGVVIAPEPISNICPLCVMSENKSRQGNGEGAVVTQYDMSAVEKIGLLKFDFLGLKTLTVIDKTLKMLVERGVKVDINSVAIDDQKTFELLRRGDTASVFQLESSGMRTLIKKIQPAVFEDIVALMALYRPGPLGSGMVEDFVRRKKGEVAISYQWPEMEEALHKILKDTYGVILYQEQVMQISNVIAGYTLAQADILRKAMGKKKPEEMAKQQKGFVDGAAKNGYPQRAAEELFDLMAKFAEYGFNKSHSVAYAYLAYQTAYLKAHSPVEFMAASLSAEVGVREKMLPLINECRNIGVNLLPPDVNESDMDFRVVGGNIRMGLTAINNVGEAAIGGLIEERRMKGEYATLEDLLERVDKTPAFKLNKKNIENMALAGTFDRLFGGDPHIARPMALACYESMCAEKKAPKRKAARTKAPAPMTGQPGLFFGEASSPPAKCLATDYDNAEAAPDEEREEPVVAVDPWDEKTLLVKEKQALGFFLSGHPVLSKRQKLEPYGISTVSSVVELEDGENKEIERHIVRIAGVITGIKEKTVKNKDGSLKRFAFLTIEDETGVIEVLVGSTLYEKKVDELKHDEVYIIDCVVMGDGVNIKKFADNIKSPKQLREQDKTYECEDEGIKIRKKSVNRYEIILDAYPDIARHWMSKIKPYLDRRNGWQNGEVQLEVTLLDAAIGEQGETANVRIGGSMKSVRDLRKIIETDASPAADAAEDFAETELAGAEMAPGMQVAQ